MRQLHHQVAQCSGTAAMLAGCICRLQGPRGKLASHSPQAAALHLYAALSPPQPVLHLRSRDPTRCRLQIEVHNLVDNPTYCGGMQVAATGVCHKPIPVARHGNLDSAFWSRWEMQFREAQVTEGQSA